MKLLSVNKIQSILFLMFSLLITSCSNMPNTNEEDLYRFLEETAAMHITQTYEARPTETPLPSDTPIPTATSEPLDSELITRDSADNGNSSDMIIRQAEAIEPSPTPTIIFPDKADYLSALPSPNQFVPGQKFMLTWEIKNIGTSTWSGKYRFHYSDGIHLIDTDSYTFDQMVAPGESIRVSLPATAPTDLGNYKTTWSLENPDGIVFYNMYYYAIVGSETFITALPEEQSTATPSGAWWMCTDAQRSQIQGAGCDDYCTPEMISQLAVEGKKCYSYGEAVE